MSCQSSNNKFDTKFEEKYNTSNKLQEPNLCQVEKL